jgi:phenylacetate-coenzyme A ligase PaaK-like adenylate-forming protein
MTDPRAIVRELLTHTTWSATQLAEHQRRRLAALLRFAVTTSPYYRRVLGPRAADTPLDQLPTLSKATLMEQFDDIVTDRRLRRAALEAHLAGPDAAQPLDDYLVLSTSGSTGRPGIVVYAAEEMAVAVAGLMRAMVLFGVRPDTRLVGIGAPSALHISRHLVAGLLAGRPSLAPRLSVTTPIPQLVEALNAFQPEAFPTNASIAALLAEEQLAGRLAIAPRIVACTSEVLTADMRTRIRQAWSAELHELYATTEAAVLASTSPQQVGLHLWEDLAIVEVVDADNRPVPPGVPGHKVLVTNLVNRIQPLIRYELSDSVTLAEVADSTGWPFRRIAAIEGRSDDIVELPAADGGTIALHPLHLRAPFAGFPDVVQYQIVHDERGFSASVVLRPDAPLDTARRVQVALVRRLAEAGAIAPPITVTPVMHIDHEGGHAGKFAVVKSLLRPSASSR